MSKGAAHALRSSLAALLLQAERRAAADLTASLQQHLLILRQGIERDLDQLLAYACTQPAIERPVYKSRRLVSGEMHARCRKQELFFQPMFSAIDRRILKKLAQPTTPVLGREQT